ncbi:unnamed protein product [Menidia menidia]|uniref:(Atlantic silverside) hypothetical protein n=1 Tax=Menidia menidia TaxID=238744 RepID=A0A8S4BQR6_9TELE|nr:unnamed protein product [Menidia menidia]
MAGVWAASKACGHLPRLDSAVCLQSFRRHVFQSDHQDISYTTSYLLFPLLLSRYALLLHTIKPLIACKGALWQKAEKDGAGLHAVVLLCPPRPAGAGTSAPRYLDGFQLWFDPAPRATEEFQLYKKRIFNFPPRPDASFDVALMCRVGETRAECPVLSFSLVVIPPEAAVSTRHLKHHRSDPISRDASLDGFQLFPRSTVTLKPAQRAASTLTQSGKLSSSTKRKAETQIEQPFSVPPAVRMQCCWPALEKKPGTVLLQTPTVLSDKAGTEKPILTNRKCFKAKH